MEWKCAAKLRAIYSLKEICELKKYRAFGRSKGFIDEYKANKRCHCDTNSQNR